MEGCYGVAEDDLTPSRGWSLARLRKTWSQRTNAVAPWWAANSKEADNSGLDGLARALQKWSTSRSGRRAGAALGFAKFTATRCWARSVRFTTGAIRVAADGHHVTLSRLGSICTHGSTRTLARRWAAGAAGIVSATVGVAGGRWQCAVEVMVAAKTRPGNAGRSPHRVGVDVGVKDLLVVATSDGVAVAGIAAPKPLIWAQSWLPAARMAPRW